MGEPYPSAERQSVYSAAPGHSLGESYSSAEMQSVYSAAPAERVKTSGVICFKTSIIFSSALSYFIVFSPEWLTKIIISLI